MEILVAVGMVLLLAGIAYQVVKGRKDKDSPNSGNGSGGGARDSRDIDKY